MKKAPKIFSHHAYLVRGDLANARARTMEIITEHGIEITGNPDVSITETDELSIDDARILAYQDSLAPVSEDQKIIVAVFSRARREAWNALLKTLEEPKKSIFFLVTTSSADIPLTVLSRVQTIDTESKASTQMYRDFFRLDPAARLVALGDMVFFDDKREPSQKRVEASNFLAALETWLRSFPLEKKKDISWSRAARAVMKAKKEVLDAVAPYKSIIERIVIILPEGK